MWEARKRAHLPILEVTFFIDSSPFSTQELAQAFPFPFGSFLCFSYGSRKNGTARESVMFCHKDKWIQKSKDSKKNAPQTNLKKIHTIQKKEYAVHTKLNMKFSGYRRTNSIQSLWTFLSCSIVPNAKHKNKKTLPKVLPYGLLRAWKIAV